MINLMHSLGLYRFVVSEKSGWMIAKWAIYQLYIAILNKLLFDEMTSILHYSTDSVKTNQLFRNKT
jgi:hypothetical protein